MMLLESLSLRIQSVRLYRPENVFVVGKKELVEQHVFDHPTSQPDSL